MGSGRKQQWGCDYFEYVKDGDTEKRIHRVGRFGFCARATRGGAGGVRSSHGNGQQASPSPMPP